MVENSWAKPRKSFHISHFPSNCEIFENRSRLVELNFLKHQIDLTGRIPDDDHQNSRLNKIICFLNKNAAMNFWTSMSISSNICITCITFAYAFFCKIFAKLEFSICTIIRLHLHLHIHAGANSYITSTYICICIKNTCITRNFHLHHHMAAFMSGYPIRIFALDIPWTNIYIHIRICIRIKDICITSTCIPKKKKNLHLRYHIAAFMSAYPIRIFCIRHSMNKYLHPHLHLYPHEGHLHNKTFIRTITRLRSCLHIQ